MRPVDLFREAFAGLAARTGRTVWMVFGTVAGTATLVAITGTLTDVRDAPARSLTLQDPTAFDLTLPVKAASPGLFDAVRARVADRACKDKHFLHARKLQKQLEAKIVEEFSSFLDGVAA